MQDPFEESGFADGDFDETAGTFEGRPFPSEAEWLDLPSPPISSDFVERALAALHEAGSSLREWPGEDRLTPTLLAAFAAPEPSRGFAAKTLRAVQEDRRTHWRELLARHVVPDPSPDFVARTLAALARTDDADDLDARDLDARNQGAASRKSAFHRRWIWPLLTIAATAAVVFLLQRTPPPPLELRLAQQVRPAFAHAYAASPLAAVLAALDQRADPDAPPNGAADGIWLLQGSNR